MTSDEPKYSDQDIDDALNAARQQAEAADDELLAAGWVECAEFFHRYLRHRDRLTDSDTHE